MTSIVVVGRDQFSKTEACLDNTFKYIPQGTEVILVLGGAPKKLKEDLQKKFSGRVKFIFLSQFLNPAQSRNIGLRAVTNPLAVLMENDVFVRPDWLGPLVQCQKETGAAMVVPLILDGPRRIHCAGNDFYITYEGKKKYGSKTLRFYGRTFCESSNLKRVPTDYGELHCQLVDVQVALKVGAYDENIMEVGECDAGFAWQKAGCSMWFEPRSVVYYHLPARVEHPMDIKFFDWRWNMRSILDGYVYFRDKWGIDISENGQFREFLVIFNNKLGLLPRLFPCGLTLGIDHGLGNLRRSIVKLLSYYWPYTKARIYGYGEWLKDRY